jgi:hypothetical protein
MKVGTRIVVAALIFLIATHRSDAANDTRSAEVWGTVTDVNAATVESAALTFQGQNQSIIAETGADGKYSILLDPGTYMISVSKRGFRPLRRATFLAQKGARIQFDFQLWVSASDSFGTYNFVELETATHTTLRPLVLFGESHKHDELEEFNGPVFGKKYPAVLTFNLLTVGADRFTYDRAKHAVLASGNVVWQDGRSVNTAVEIEIVLDGLDPPIHVNGRSKTAVATSP